MAKKNFRYYENDVLDIAMNLYKDSDSSRYRYTCDIYGFRKNGSKKDAPYLTRILRGDMTEDIGIICQEGCGANGSRLHHTDVLYYVSKMVQKIYDYIWDDVGGDLRVAIKISHHKIKKPLHFWVRLSNEKECWGVAKRYVKEAPLKQTVYSAYTHYDIEGTEDIHPMYHCLLSTPVVKLMSGKKFARSWEECYEDSDKNMRQETIYMFEDVFKEIYHDSIQNEGTKEWKYTSFKSISPTWWWGIKKIIPWNSDPSFYVIEDIGAEIRHNMLEKVTEILKNDPTKICLKLLRLDRADSEPSSPGSYTANINKYVTIEKTEVDKDVNITFVEDSTSKNIGRLKSITFDRIYNDLRLDMDGGKVYCFGWYTK